MLRMETLLWSVGIDLVAGVDEVGLGPLAGPVVAAAVVFPAGVQCTPVDDSKKLSAARREALDARIRAEAAQISIASVEVPELDGLGVRRAGNVAMRRAVEGLAETPGHLLVDAVEIEGVSVGQTSLVKADTFIHSVAAASVIAKVHRDAIMRDLDVDFPGYGFGRHMGYGTAAHLEALAELGPTPHHRRSFAPIRRLLGP